MGLGKTFHELPPKAKGIIAVGITLVTVLAAIAIWKAVKNKLDNAKLAKEGNASKSELKDLKKQGVEPTISTAQAESFSNSLVSAFDGCGTDEDAVYNIMAQMKNDADIYLLLSTYGVRKYDSCNWTFDFGNDTKSLSGAISDELDAEEKDKVNKILTTNGVTFQFT